MIPKKEREINKRHEKAKGETITGKKAKLNYLWVSLRNMFRGWQAEIQKTKKIKIKINICFNESTIYEETAWRQFSFHTRLNTLQEETVEKQIFHNRNR